jgi:hypothetical protein
LTFSELFSLTMWKTQRWMVSVVTATCWTKASWTTAPRIPTRGATVRETVFLRALWTPQHACRIPLSTYPTPTSSVQIHTTDNKWMACNLIRRSTERNWLWNQ